MKKKILFDFKTIVAYTLSAIIIIFLFYFLNKKIN